MSQNESTPMTPDVSNGAIAIIVVHGVSDPSPGEYSASVADQLRGLTGYADFVKGHVRLKVEPVRTIPKSPDASSPTAQATPTYGGLRAQHTPLSVRNAIAGYAKSDATHDPQAEADKLSLETMTDQLSDLEVPANERFHETTCYYGERQRDGRTQDVDVHELYWGDLSRAGPSALRWFIELYQLLFQFVALGRFALDYARGVHPKSKFLSFISKVHHLARVLLTILVPTANAWLAILSVGMLVGLALPANYSELGSLIVIGVLALFVWKFIIVGFERDLPGIQPWFLLLGILGNVGFWFAGDPLSHWLAKSIPNQGFAEVLAIDIPTLAPKIRDAGLCWMGALYLIWALLTPTLFLAVLLQSFAPRISTDEPEHQRMKRSLWTVIVSLLPTSAILLLLNLGLWAAALKLVTTFSDKLHNAGPFLSGSNSLLERSADIAGPTAFLVLALIGFAWWSFGCGIKADLHWRRNLAKQMDPAESKKLGASMTTGFKRMRRGTEIFKIGLLVLWIVLALCIYLQGSTASRLQALNHWTLYALGGFFFILVFPRGPLQGVAKGFGAVLDTILDVINWLRPYPNAATPRARICARYTSLLRHLCSPAACGKTYDKIIIVAHSQGNMVTTDLFRYLTAANTHGACEPGLEPIFQATPTIKVSYLSLASPLRQIYCLRFPHQYAWARSEFTTGTPLRPTAQVFHMEQITNAFHAGDYIGRHLWTDPESDASFIPVNISENPAGRTREFCLGSGGHLHYFDPASLAVVQGINRLID
jgi:hypothetical protein